MAADMCVVRSQQGSRAVLKSKCAWFGVGMLALIAGCMSRDPLANLSAEDKAFLFADTGTNAPFLGQPLDNGPLTCYPQRMNQGYVLIDGQDKLFLDSIRPTGVERHEVLSVTSDENKFVIGAKNGVGATFDLFIDRKDKDLVLISWDGAPAHLYRRCGKVGE